MGFHSFLRRVFCCLHPKPLDDSNAPHKPTTESSTTSSPQTTNTFTPDYAQNDVARFPRNTVAPEQGNVVHGLKTTLILLQRTLGEVPIPGVKPFLSISLDIVDLIEKMTSNQRDFIEIYDLMLEINVRFTVLKNRYSMPEELEERVASIASHIDEFLPALQDLINRGFLERAWTAKDDQLLVVRFFSRIKQDLDSLTGDAAIHAAANVSILVDNELRKNLQFVQTAVWDVGNGPDESLPETRQDILRDLTSWLKDDTQPHVCLLHGMAGTGKTAIAKSFCRDAQERGVLGGTFFCSRKNEERRNAGRIIPSIAFQLSAFNNSYGRQLAKIIKGWNGLVTANPADQWKKLIIEPFETMAPGSVPVLIVIDGIDECDDKEGRGVLWACLSGPMPGNLKVLVAARPDGNSHARNIYSVNLNSFRQFADSDIQLYVQKRLQKLSPPGMQWPPNEDVSRIVKQSQGLFIYAAEVCRQVEAPGSAVIHLSNLLNKTRDIPAGMQRFYGRIFVSAVGSFSDENIAVCRSILGMLALWKEQKLSLSDLSTLHGHDTTHVRSLLVGFHSILHIPEDVTDSVRVYHPSLTEFLIARQVWQSRCDLDGCENSQCRDHPRLDFFRLYMPKKQHHLSITTKLLQYMTRHIPTDIGIAQRDIGTSHLVGVRRSPVDGALEYACRHWADHLFLSDSDSRRDVNGLATLVISFLEAKGGLWLGIIVSNEGDSFHEPLRDLQSVDTWQRLHSSTFVPETQKALQWLIRVGISRLETVIRSEGRHMRLEETITQDVRPTTSPIFPHDAHRAPPLHSPTTGPQLQMPIPSVFDSPHTQARAGAVPYSYTNHTLRHYRSWQKEDSLASRWRQSLLIRPSKSSCFAEEMP
ncbi:uncharacterized protein EV420DRAFT_1730832 [Desarmillaria tabescens]|uniref:Nephrocystin 3-like N-terminal domain-containing protein n=1 Tax=Armillaria tabescens TaxID=1929756 RepID=A0AA39JE02_ARMTA|nr:uncharacterized protein EV420DRAFT_1730832 [Desarmillaria tabescens]KAK0440873.1 hypothetical protein EV420DRAFT_1730832 [Desarmillaria tabescens]